MNMVNQTYAEAAAQAAPEVRAYLIEVMRPVYGEETPQMVDRIADHMGRHVREPESHP